jgi:polysaccharide pyruvyl transferase WcaK-like protein
MNKYIVLNHPDFVPASWKECFGSGKVYMFNPGIIKAADGWIFAYRMVGVDGFRRIALCRLDSGYQLKKETIVPFSDIIKFSNHNSFSQRALSWFADPRLFRLAGRLYIYWNSGMHESFNHQFIVELDGSTLQPIGRARELVMEGERRQTEKNWTFFGDGPFYALYSIEPHCVMEFSLQGEKEIKFHPAVVVNWNDNGWSASYGDLRGGAIPQRLGNYYYNFCHSLYGVEGSYMCAPAVYRFAADYPFAPKDVSHKPLELANPFGFNDSPERLNPAVKQVLYPCGAVFNDGKWIVSYGVNDEYSIITEISGSEIDTAFSPESGSKVQEDQNVTVIRKTSRSVYVGFDFWGHGNIGDDLMIAGFKKALSSHKGVHFNILSATNYFIESQKIRFPDIAWHRKLPDNSSDKAVGIHTTWVGPGATPFQLTCGDYVLKYWLEQLPFIKTFDRKCLVNVGAEQEIEPEKERFSLVANIFDKISTRDRHSADILTKMLGVDGSKVYAGADLANIVLADYIDAHGNARKKFNLGVIIAGDTLSDEDIAGVKEFLMTRWRRTSFIAGDVREIERHECRIFKEMTADSDWWAKRKLVLSVPDYMNGDIRSLLMPIDECSTIISSRYHGLLIAAWMGCKVAAIARSSKIEPLAKELQIPVCYPPLTKRKIETIQKEACFVSLNILNEAKEKALEAVRFGMDL